MRLTSQEFVNELTRLDISRDEFADRTGISKRAIESYIHEHRRVPKWMPFIIACLRMTRTSESSLR